MQKINKDVSLASLVEGNGFIIKIGGTVYTEIRQDLISFHNAIAKGIIEGNQKLKEKYKKTPYRGQPAIFLVYETPAIMVSKDGLKRVIYRKEVKKDKLLKEIIKNYNKRGYKSIIVS